MSPNRYDEVDDNPSAVLDKNSDLYAVHQLFNASTASRRIFSEVHFHEPEDPDLTIGMGHWIRDNIAGLFHLLRSDERLWEDVTGIWASTLSEAQWSLFHQETHIRERGGIGISAGLDRILCAADPDNECVANHLIPWASTVGERFNGSSHWFTAGWKCISRLKPVAAAQLNYWATSVLEKGVTDAHERGIFTRGGIASVISARSSGIKATMFDVGSGEVRATHGSFARRWSLVNVPDSAKPLGVTGLSDDQLLQDWRAVAAWQYYTVKKGEVRSRMKAIWKMYYEESWGPLRSYSLSDATLIPRHNGVAMDVREFDFSVVF